MSQRKYSFVFVGQGVWEFDEKGWIPQWCKDHAADINDYLNSQLHGFPSFEFSIYEYNMWQKDVSRLIDYPDYTFFVESYNTFEIEGKPMQAISAGCLLSQVPLQYDKTSYPHEAQILTVNGMSYAEYCKTAKWDIHEEPTLLNVPWDCPYLLLMHAIQKQDVLLFKTITEAGGGGWTWVSDTSPDAHSFRMLYQNHEFAQRVHELLNRLVATGCHSRMVQIGPKGDYIDISLYYLGMKLKDDKLDHTQLLREHITTAPQQMPEHLYQNAKLMHTFFFGN